VSKGDSEPQQEFCHEFTNVPEMVLFAFFAALRGIFNAKPQRTRSNESRFGKKYIVLKSQT
jgi:hypothetical protein